MATHEIAAGCCYGMKSSITIGINGVTSALTSLHLECHFFHGLVIRSCGSWVIRCRLEFFIYEHANLSFFPHYYLRIPIQASSARAFLTQNQQTVGIFSLNKTQADVLTIHTFTLLQHCKNIMGVEIHGGTYRKQWANDLKHHFSWETARTDSLCFKELEAILSV